MITTTFAACYTAGACMSGYRKMAKAVGGIKAYGHDKPTSIRKVLTVLGPREACWVLCSAAGPIGIEIGKAVWADYWSSVPSGSRLTYETRMAALTAIIRRHLKEAKS